MDRLHYSTSPSGSGGVDRFEHKQGKYHRISPHEYVQNTTAHDLIDTIHTTSHHDGEVFSGPEDTTESPKSYESIKLIDEGTGYRITGDIENGMHAPAAFDLQTGNPILLQEIDFTKYTELFDTAQQRCNTIKEYLQKNDRYDEEIYAAMCVHIISDQIAKSMRPGQDDTGYKELTKESIQQGGVLSAEELEKKEKENCVMKSFVFNKIFNDNNFSTTGHIDVKGEHVYNTYTAGNTTYRVDINSPTTVSVSGQKTFYAANAESITGGGVTIDKRYAAIFEQEMELRTSSESKESQSVTGPYTPKYTIT